MSEYRDKYETIGYQIPVEASDASGSGRPG